MPQKKTKVIFRKFRGEVVALFPQLAGTNYSFTCLAYAREGQHFSTDLSQMMYDSRPATPSEYSSLKKELTSIGYNLEVAKRSTPTDRKMREQQIRRNPERKNLKNQYSGFKGQYYVQVLRPPTGRNKNQPWAAYYLKSFSGAKFSFTMGYGSAKFMKRQTAIKYAKEIRNQFSGGKVEVLGRI